MHNFLTRDGTPPTEVRRIAREQLSAYTNVELRDAAVERIGGEKGAFELTAGGSVVTAKRLLLCTGMIDELPALPGFADYWGHSIVQCPYCHGWEVKDKRWGYLLREEARSHVVPFVMQLRGWTNEVQLFTNGVQIAKDATERLSQAGIGVVAGLVTAVEGESSQLRAVVLADGQRVACDVLFAHPPQRQVPVVVGLGLELDEDGYVAADAMTSQTSIPGVYVAGDLSTRMQAAILAAAAGVRAAAMMNVDLALS
jgi:thioredoxin reductase